MKDNLWKYVPTKYWKIIFCPKFKLHTTVHFQRSILDPKCASGVDNLRCPSPTIVTPSSSVVIAIASTQTTPAIEKSSTRLTLHPSMSATMSASSQLLITKTASPAVMTSCPNVCNRTACYEGMSSGKYNFSATGRCSYDWDICLLSTNWSCSVLFAVHFLATALANSQVVCPASHHSRWISFVFINL